MLGGRGEWGRWLSRGGEQIDVPVDSAEVRAIRAPMGRTVEKIEKMRTEGE